MFSFLAVETVILKSASSIEQLGNMETLPPGIANTKHLHVRLFELRTPAYANVLARLIEAMPNLRSFHFYDESYENSQPSQWSQQCQWLRPLKRLPNLETVQFNIAFLEEVHEIDTARTVGVEVAGFKNLTSLQLYNLQGPELEILKDLTKTLQACPQLTCLGLGRSSSPADDPLDSVKLEGEIDLLEKLCNEYAENGRSVPLPVRTLRLGTSFTPYKNKPGNYLSQLLRLEKLRNLHIWNGNYDRLAETCTEIDWALFDSSDILNLEITLLDGDLLEWLNDKNTVQELILIEPYWKGDIIIQGLRLSSLNTFYIQDSYTTGSNFHPHFTVGEFDALPSTQGGEHNLVQNHGESREEFINRLAAIAHGATPQHTTIVDLLHDKGKSLKRLAISMHFETQFPRFVDNLKQMSKLTTLRMEPFQDSHFPPPSASCWKDVTTPQEIALHYVKDLKAACPSLQCIKIGKYAWQIVRNLESPSRDGHDYIFIRQDGYIDLFLYHEGYSGLTTTTTDEGCSDGNYEVNDVESD